MANRKLLILVGARYGRLTVLSEEGKDAYGKYLYKCICDCGKETIVLGTDLNTGKVVSCGCFKSEHAKNVRGFHGLADTKIYTIWSLMLQRCENKKSAAYKNYGGRGISVCPDWHKFRKFYNWAISQGYKDGLSIERIDVNENYCPENCTFIEKAEQCFNKQNTIRYKGESLALVCRRLGLKYSSVYARINQLNWPIERAVETPFN